jgi:hypothetical protein
VSLECRRNAARGKGPARRFLPLGTGCAVADRPAPPATTPTAVPRWGICGPARDSHTGPPAHGWACTRLSRRVRTHGNTARSRQGVCTPQRRDRGTWGPQDAFPREDPRHRGPMSSLWCADGAVSVCPGARRGVCACQCTPRPRCAAVEAACLRRTCGRSVCTTWSDGRERCGELWYNRALWRLTQASPPTSVAGTAG